MTYLTSSHRAAVQELAIDDNSSSDTPTGVDYNQGQSVFPPITKSVHSQGANLTIVGHVNRKIVALLQKFAKGDITPIQVYRLLQHTFRGVNQPRRADADANERAIIEMLGTRQAEGHF